MFAFLTVLALVLALGAIIGIVALVRAYWNGVSRHALIAGIVGVVVALGGTIASAVGAAHLAPAASTPAKQAAVTVVDGEEVSSEDLIPNVDAVIDLNQIVVDERFGGYSRYVLRSSWPSLAEVRSHYSGFEDAVSLPLVVDQAWFDAAFDWGPHGQTVTNPDGSTSTVASYADLNSALKSILPPAAPHKTLAKIYQALRIEVNGEMRSLEQLLRGIALSLKPGGIAAVITYHSLEDRMVKNFFRCGDPHGRQDTDIYCRKPAPFSVITRKPVLPGEAEIMQNTRARSAKLRAARRTQS